MTRHVSEQTSSQSDVDLITLGEYLHIYDPSVGEKSAWYINDHCVLRGNDGKWHMFGITHEEPLNPVDEKILAHATAAKLTQIPWEKHPPAIVADKENWGEYHLWAPHVQYHEGVYYMYVCVGGERNSEYKTHLLTSPDLWEWKRHSENPVIVDGYDARDPHVVKVENQWVMYYTATSNPDGGNHIVACQTSNDLIKWSNRQIVFMDEEKGTWGGSTESPFIVNRGGFFYLFICNNDRRRGYSATDVFKSDDPFHWEKNQRIATIPGHAAEIIQDLDGKWYATHCGWGQGGLYLAPLYWND
jgi:arabinan endo-1,5-alpha-L-arabinosidase